MRSVVSLYELNSKSARNSHHVHEERKCNYKGCDIRVWVATPEAVLVHYELHFEKSVRGDESRAATAVASTVHMAKVNLRPFERHIRDAQLLDAYTLAPLPTRLSLVGTPKLAMPLLQNRDSDTKEAFLIAYILDDEQCGGIGRRSPKTPRKKEAENEHNFRMIRFVVAIKTQFYPFESQNKDPSTSMPMISNAASTFILPFGNASPEDEETVALRGGNDATVIYGVRSIRVEKLDDHFASSIVSFREGKDFPLQKAGGKNHSLSLNVVHVTTKAVTQSDGAVQQQRSIFRIVSAKKSKRASENVFSTALQLVACDHHQDTLEMSATPIDCIDEEKVSALRSLFGDLSRVAYPLLFVLQPADHPLCGLAGESAWFLMKFRQLVRHMKGPEPILPLFYTSCLGYLIKFFLLLSFTKSLMYLISLIFTSSTNT